MEIWGGSMTQYKSEVEQQAILLELEAWAKETKSYHFHNLSNLWYDDRPQDTKGGKYVADTIYNNGLVERVLENSKVVIMGKKLSTQDLLEKYLKGE